MKLENEPDETLVIGIFAIVIVALIIVPGCERQRRLDNATFATQTNAPIGATIAPERHAP